MVEESQPSPQRLPVEIAALMALESSVVPSPVDPNPSVFTHSKNKWSRLTSSTKIFDIAKDLVTRVAISRFAVASDRSQPVVSRSRRWLGCLRPWNSADEGGRPDGSQEELYEYHK